VTKLECVLDSKCWLGEAPTWHAGEQALYWTDVPARKLHPSARLDYDQLALVETLGIGAHAVERAQLTKDDFVLVIGAGPIGLLAALIGKQLGLDVHVLDRNETGPKPELVRALGATYHATAVTDVGFEPDVIVECTGVGQVIAEAIQAVAPGGVVCLTGVGSGGRTVGLAVADVASNVVLRNNVVVGSVNANKRHWYRAAQVLARADPAWLARLVTRREPAEQFMRALQRQPEDIKVVIQFAHA